MIPFVDTITKGHSHSYESGFARTSQPKATATLLLILIFDFPVSKDYFWCATKFIAWEYALWSVAVFAGLTRNFSQRISRNDVSTLLSQCFQFLNVNQNLFDIFLTRHSEIKKMFFPKGPGFSVWEDREKIINTFFISLEWRLPHFFYEKWYNSNRLREHNKVAAYCKGYLNSMVDWH